MKWFHKLIIPIIAGIVTLCSSNIQWNKNNWKNIIEADGKGYYAYLPAIFIYHDLNFSFFDSVEKAHPNPTIFYDYRVNHNGKTADKYFAGTAIAMTPFFLAAHSIALITGDVADGYSKIYLIFVNLAAIFYLFLGLFYLKKILLEFGVKENVISFLLVIITFATNLFFYSFRESAMSHVYSFAFVNVFIFHLLNYFKDPNERSFYSAVAVYGIIMLIRPANGVVILIVPFIAGGKQQFLAGLNYLKGKWQSSVNAILLFFCIISVQLLIYKIQTGSFWIDSYGEEKFNWRDPHPIDFLFSYKKGLFVYTPVVFFSLFGFYGLFKQNRFRFYSLLGFLVILIYVLSSWWNWWYGGSFGTRVFVEYYAIIALLLWWGFTAIQKKIGKIVYSALMVIALLLCQLQTYQYRYYLIHWEKMDKAHYWNVFLQTDVSHNPNADLLN